MHAVDDRGAAREPATAEREREAARRRGARTGGSGEVSSRDTERGRSARRRKRKGEAKEGNKRQEERSERLHQVGPAASLPSPRATRPPPSAAKARRRERRNPRE